MKNSNRIEQDFVIDRLTNSIINIVSGDGFRTEVSHLSKIDLKNIIKKNGWIFNWKSEFQDIKKID